MGVERGDAEHIAAMGELMGYPRCCVAAFAAQRARGDNLDLERAPLRAHPDRALVPLVSRFGAVSLLSHMLCAPDCAASRALARTRMAAAMEIDPETPPRIATHLATPVLRLDYRQAALVTGVWQGERYLVRTFRPFASADFGVDPALVRAIRIAASRVVLELEGGSEHVVAATAPVLVEPNLPLAAPVQRALEEARQQPPANRAAQNSRGVVNVAAIAALLAPNTPVGEHVVTDTELDQGGGLRVSLASGAQRLQVLIRPWDAARPALSRRGPWSLDLDSGFEPSEVERKVIGTLAMLLPAGSHQQGPSQQPS